MTNGDKNVSLQKVFGVDALTCAASAALMIGAASKIAALTALPQLLLTVAGLILLPVALLFGAMTRMSSIPSPLLLVAVLGNTAWVLASIGVILVTGPNLLGVAFVLAQATVVAVLTVLEARGLRSSREASLT